MNVKKCPYRKVVKHSIQTDTEYFRDCMGDKCMYWGAITYCYNMSNGCQEAYELGCRKVEAECK